MWREQCAACAAHDLHYVGGAKLVSIGLKKSEVARFRRELAEHAEGRQNATENPCRVASCNANTRDHDRHTRQSV